MLKLLNSLVLAVLLYLPVFGQSDDDFLSDFGGDDFEELESELELVTTNVIESVTTDTSLEKNPSNECSRAQFTLIYTSSLTNGGWVN